MTEKPRPERTPPDTRELMAPFAAILDKVNPAELTQKLQQFQEADSRSKLMNIKLTILLERSDPKDPESWKSDPRIEKLRKR